MHLIATVGGTNAVNHINDESMVPMPINGQTHVQLDQTAESLVDEGIADNHQQLPLPSLSSSITPMDAEQKLTVNDVAPRAKVQHDIAEIHRDMMALIPIPQAWSHNRHQSGLFSYPDLPHFNVIRQATYRDGRFVCPFCTVDFASKEGIRYHLYNSCTKSPYPKAFFRCLMCDSELADRSSLRTHLARHVCTV
jgi:hypothetical protein